MPPLLRTRIDADNVAAATVEALLDALAGADVPNEAAFAIRTLRQSSPRKRAGMIVDAVRNVQPCDDISQRVLVASSIHVHFARLASLLSVSTLKHVGNGACPVSGSAPATSSVVAWPNVDKARFCTCSLCATMWKIPRIQCVLCGCTSGINYHTVEGQSESVKAESCDACGLYVRILYLNSDPHLDSFADDVASLGLDILMRDANWTRGAQSISAGLLGNVIRDCASAVHQRHSLHLSVRRPNRMPAASREGPTCLPGHSAMPETALCSRRDQEHPLRCRTKPFLGAPDGTAT